MPGWEDNFVDVEIECPYCNDKFITQMFILDGTFNLYPKLYKLMTRDKITIT